MFSPPAGFESAAPKVAFEVPLSAYETLSVIHKNTMSMGASVAHQMRELFQALKP